MDEFKEMVLSEVSLDCLEFTTQFDLTGAGCNTKTCTSAAIDCGCGCWK